MQARKSLHCTSFIVLCIIVFLAVCNVAIFFNLQLHLQELGFRKSVSGLLVSLYSVAAIVLYATASFSINERNALKVMRTGILLTLISGLLYPLASGFAFLALLRIVQGTGIFTILAPAMVILVRIIPRNRSGTAFSYYSIALLLPYSILPTVSESLLPLLTDPTWLYAGASLLMLPSLALSVILQRLCSLEHEEGQQKTPTTSALNLIRELRHPNLMTILFVNCAYFMIFSSLFFLMKDIGATRGIQELGFFFSIQMGVMICIRLFGSSIFDTLSKTRIVTSSLLLTAGGFVMLLSFHSPVSLYPIAALFGLGMGLCVPPLNSLMYLSTRTENRAFNANMMMLSLHFGTFCGPFVGSIVAESFGYQVFLFLAAAGTLAIAALLVIMEHTFANSPSHS